jgi:hypothetical protein
MSGEGMDALRAALGKIGPRPVEVVSDSYAGDGLVRLTVRSDGTVSVEIDAYAAEEARVSDIERHLTELFRAAKVPDPAKAAGEERS